MKVMCSKVEGEVNSYQQELEKFSARWQQLKPQDDLLEGDREACTAALASLKERRSEFDELLATGDRLKYVCGCVDVCVCVCRTILHTYDIQFRKGTYIVRLYNVSVENVAVSLVLYYVHVPCQKIQTH